MSSFNTQLMPRCVGRFMIDVPSTMKPGVAAAAVVSDVEITVQPMQRSLFDAQFTQREQQLRAEHLNGKPGVASLTDVVAFTAPVRGAMFNRSKDRSSPVARTLELVAWKDGYKIVMLSNARDLRDEQNRAPGDTRRSNIAEKREHLLALFERVRGRTDAEIPKEQGLCIANGFVRGPAIDAEEVSLNYVLDTMSDVVLHFESDASLRETTTLLERGKEIGAKIEASGAKTVRKGKRSGVGLEFEEWLIAGPTDDGVTGHIFTLEANSKRGSALTPMVNVDLHNGQRESQPDRRTQPPALSQASLDEAQALALWDAVTSTLRPRPGGF